MHTNSVRGYLLAGYLLREREEPKDEAKEREAEGKKNKVVVQVIGLVQRARQEQWGKVRFLVSVHLSPVN